MLTKILFLLFVQNIVFGQLITNVDARDKTSLNGKWHIIIDPYENGYFNYRYEPNPNGYFKNEIQQDKSQLLEYSFDTDEMLNVPGDWNSQKEKLLFYEGTVWYKKSFKYRLKKNKRLFVYFGAVNYEAKVYLNGDYLGSHQGGFTPFQFEITNNVKEDNFLVLKVDNKRYQDAVPTVNTDWYNYGGITRKVYLLETEQNFIEDYFIQLERGKQDVISGFVKLNGIEKSKSIKIEIPELNLTKNYKTNDDGIINFRINQKLQLWSPLNPKLYEVVISSENEIIEEKIGFRNIETEGNKILLNGEPIYLRGISIHEEAPYNGGSRSFSEDHSKILLAWAKDMSCNFVRLAHYPHNESMTRMADEMGLLVWSEIPVYWTISWENEATYSNAENQLTEMILRDKNRASVILWSVANETPLSEPRFKFLSKLVSKIRQLDDTRLVTAAMERHYIDENTQMIDDPFGEIVDVLGCNSYIGWYDGLPEKCRRISWKTTYNKPVIVSEFGGGALFGKHGDSLTRWTEEYQASVYKENIAMFDKVEFVQGMSPWILKDFKSPRRHQPRIQNFWNIKGLITDLGEKKKAYHILKNYYDSKVLN